MIETRSQFDEIRELVGDQAAGALSRAFGGKKLHIPKTIGPAHPIAVVVGIDAALKLAERFGGERLEELPRSLGRRALILDLSRQRLPVEAIRAQAGCSRRHVFQVRQEEREKTPDPQKDLFGEG